MSVSEKKINLKKEFGMPGEDKVIGERYAFREDAQRRLLSVSMEQAMKNSG